MDVAAIGCRRSAVLLPWSPPLVALALALALALAAVGARGLEAQTESARPVESARPAEAAGSAGPASSPSVFCWRGRALPACRSFAIFELEGDYALASTTVVLDGAEPVFNYAAFENELKWNLGAMANVSEAWAVGATVSLGSGSPDVLTGLRLRARRWLRPPVSVEVEAGVVATRINQPIEAGAAWGPTAGARLNLADRLSLFARWEGVHADAGSDPFLDAVGLPAHREARFHQGLYVGASADSTLGVAGSAVLGAGWLVLAAMLGGDF